MYNYQLYHSDEIEKLKHELQIYKTVLRTIDSHDIAEDMLMLMNQNERLTETLSILKGDMKKMNENIERQLKETEKREHHISARIQTLDNSFDELKRDVNKMMHKLDDLQLSKLVKKVNDTIENEDKENATKSELEAMKAEMMKLKQQLEHKNTPETTKPQTTSPRQSEFRRLQNMLQSQNMFQSPNIVSNRLPKSKKEPKMISGSQSEKPKVTMKSQKKFHVPNSQPNGVNRNIITRIKTNESIVKKGEIDQTKPFEENKQDKVDKAELIIKNKQDEMNQAVTINNQPSSSDGESTETTSLSKGDVNKQSHTDMLFKEHQTRDSHENQSPEKPEKPSIFSIFKKG